MKRKFYALDADRGERKFFAIIMAAAAVILLSSSSAAEARAKCALGKVWRPSIGVCQTKGKAISLGVYKPRKQRVAQRTRIKRVAVQRVAKKPSPRVPYLRAQWPTPETIEERLERELHEYVERNYTLDGEFKADQQRM